MIIVPIRIFLRIVARYLADGYIVCGQGIFWVPCNITRRTALLFQQGRGDHRQGEQLRYGSFVLDKASGICIVLPDPYMLYRGKCLSARCLLVCIVHCFKRIALQSPRVWVYSHNDSLLSEDCSHKGITVYCWTTRHCCG